MPSHKYPKESKHQRTSSTVEVPADGMEVYEVDEDDDDDVPDVRQHFANSAFEQKSRRMAFVRKTLFTVLLQLLFCAAITAGCYFAPGARKWMEEYWYIGLIGGVFWMAISIAVGCCGVGRGPPSCCNISLLIFATLCLTTLCAFMTVGYDQGVILYSLASTVLVLLIIVVITACTPIDITGWGIFLLGAGLVLFVAAIMASIFLAVCQTNRETRRIIALCICILFILLLTFTSFTTYNCLLGGGSINLRRRTGSMLV